MSHERSSSLIFGWPSRIEADEKSDTMGLHPLTKKRGQHDLSYAIRYEGDGHCITFAPTGSGKGVGVIIPNLLHYTGPPIVVDPKGENFAVTARYRRETLGQQILLLDPFHQVHNSVLDPHNVRRRSLNPLDLCRLSGHSIENDAQMIAQLLAGPGVANNDPFWDITAIFLLSGLISHEMCQAVRQSRLPSFSNVVNYLFSDDTVVRLAKMLDNENPVKFTVQCVGGFLQREEKLRQSILAVAQSYVSTVMAEDLQPHLNSSTIDLASILSGENYTLYIVIPPNKLESHSFLLRIWISVLLHAVMERKELPQRRTLFILDECANLGELKALSKAVTLLRGYGLQVWMLFQDMSQLIDIYGEQHHTMINNCGVLQAFGAARLSAAKPLASLIGTYSSKDIISLDRTQQIISMSPGKVRTAKLFRYYSDEAFNTRHDINPLRPKEEPPVLSIRSRNSRRRFNFI